MVFPLININSAIIYYKYYYYHCRPIHDAVDAGNFSIVSILVQNGADPLVEYSERTPLELAKSAGHLEIAAFLSGKGRWRLVVRNIIVM